MEQGTDLQAVRLLSYTILGMFLVIPVMVFLILLVMGLPEGSRGHALSAIGSFGILMSYVTNAGVLLCLYRMGGLGRYFRYAQTAFVAWILLGTVSQMVFQLWHSLGDGSGTEVLSVIFSALPVIFITAGIFFALMGLEVLCGVVEQEKEAAKLRGLRKKWLIIQTVRLLYMRIGFWLSVPVAAFFAGFLILLAVYEMIGIHIFRTAREVCKSYYFYALKSEQKLYDDRRKI